MIVINNIDDTRFSFNGVEYFKNFTPVVIGNYIRILNTYDSAIELTSAPTLYSDFEVDSVTYGSAALLQSAILPVLFSRVSLGGGGVTPKYATLTSSQLATQDVDGFVAYANALNPNLVIAPDEFYDFIVTDTGMYFKLYLSGVTIGLGQTPINTADVKANRDYWNNAFLNTYRVISRGDVTLTVIGAGAFVATGTGGVIVGGTGLYDNIKQKNGVTSTTATAGSTCGYRDGSQTFFNFRQGFKMVFKFANSDAATVADARTFVGCINSNAQIGNVNPSTLLNFFALASDNGEANFSIMHNDNTGTATKFPLGVNFPANTSKTDVYQVTFMTFPNSNILHWEVIRLNTMHIASGTITTDFTPSAAGYAPHLWHNSGATALAVNQTFISFIANFYN